MSNALSPLALAAAGLFAAHQAWTMPPANDCSDPYWANALRCKAFPGQVPQPLPTAPATPAGIKEFTRVDLLSDLSVRCLDGTRPILYVDPAIGGASNKWILSVTGGGSCSARDSDSNGTFDDGQACADIYFGGEAGEMGTANEPPMKNLAGDSNSSAGINKPHAALNPIFADYNRVRIEKCSYDRYNGRATHPGLNASTPGGAPFSYTLLQHGKKIVRMALDELRGDAGTGQGLSYRTWVNQGGGIMELMQSLPPLESAEAVLLVGHSGGAHGLMHNVDFIVSYLQSWSVFGADTRVVLDANFLPAMENAVAFDPLQGGDLYDHVWAGAGPEIGAYDGAVYYADSDYARQYDAWMENPGDPMELMFDASCVATHNLSADTWKCRDRQHVLFNHLTTPFFIREDFSDPNIEHTLDGNGHPVFWGTWGSYPHCALLGIDPCPPVLPAGTPSIYRDHLEQQYRTLLADLPSRSELALGEDASGPVPSYYFWMPDCGSHSGLYNDLHYFGVTVEAGASSWTMRELLESFVTAPRVGAVSAEIDGLEGRASSCEPPIFADGFE